MPVTIVSPGSGTSPVPRYRARFRTMSETLVSKMETSRNSPPPNRARRCREATIENAAMIPEARSLTGTPGIAGAPFERPALTLRIPASASRFRSCAGRSA